MYKSMNSPLTLPSREVAIAATQALKEKEFWMNKLSAQLTMSRFPYDQSCSPANKPDIKSLELVLDREVFSRLMAISKESDPRLHMILTAGAVALLNQYTGDRDIILCTSIDRQEREKEFINTLLPLRIQIARDMSFKSLLLQVMETVNEAIEHQNYPVELLMHDDLRLTGENESSLFDLAIILENIQDKKYIEHVGCSLVFNFLRTGECINGIVEYHAGLYREDTIERIIAHFGYLMKQAVFQVDIPITSITLLGENEKKQLLYDFNQNKIPFPTNRSVIHYLKEHALKTPHRIALTYEGQQLSYYLLNKRSDRLVSGLKEKGVEADRLAGIIMNRSPQLVEVILATWKAGGAYIPIDTQYPGKRVIEILKDSDARVLLAEPHFVDSHLETTYRGEIVRICQEDVGGGWLDAVEDIPVDIGPPMTSLAYVIYTSGSTGKPKGVMVEHPGMMNHILAKINDLQLSENSIIAQNSSYTFDISVWQLFAAMIRGGTTTIYPYSLIVNPSKFILRLIKDRIAVLEVVPSYLAVILDILSESSYIPLPLKYMLVTGEEVKSHLVKQWFEAYPGIKMVNAYGPTEASDDITHHMMDKMPDIEHIPIGKPVQNLNIYIVDNNMNLCPVGVKGEICVSGIGVGRGYLNRPGLTSEKFINYKLQKTNKKVPFVKSIHSYISASVQPYSHSPRYSIYMTGDLGRWHPGGIIEFFGRKDYQVKIRGFRIELGEIESKLLACPGIKEAVVIDKEDEAGNKYLCAYLAGRNGELDIQDIKIGLGKELPAYMIPAYFVHLEEIPLTSNGKINRSALPEPVRHSTIPYISSSMLRKAGEESMQREQSPGPMDLQLSEAEKILTALGEEAEKVKSVLQEYSAKTGIDYYPLTYPQKMIYYIEKKHQGTGCNNIVFFVRYQEIIDSDKLEETINILLLKHEALRLRITEIQFESGFIPAQNAADFKKVTIDRFDFSSHGCEAQLQDWLEKKGAEAFDFLGGLLFYFAYLKLGENEFGCYMRIHNIISDGLTFHILIKEMNRIYRTLKAGENVEVKPHQSSYLSFVSHEQQYLKSRRAKEDMRFFLNDMLPPPTEVTLSSRVIESDSGQIAADRIKLIVPAELRGKIHQYMKLSKCSLYKVILSALAIYISRATGVNDFVIGSLINNRSHLRYIKTAGIFIHFLPLHVQVDTGMEFNSFVKQTSAYLDDIIANRQQYPFEILAGQLREIFGIDPSYFYNINLIGYPDLENVTMERPFSGFEEAPFSLYVNRYNRDIYGSLEFEWIFRKGLFLETEIKHIHHCLENILNNALNNPGKKISEIELLSPGEKIGILSNFTRQAALPKMDIPVEISKNTLVYILNEKGILQPVGVPGELYVSCDNQGLENCIQNPFLKDGWLYKTGESAIWRADGKIKLQGKIEHQVHIKGIRVDLRKIENSLLSFNGIKEAVVVRKYKKGFPYLCAFITSKKELTKSELSGYLSNQFPSYMIPEYFVTLEKMPLTTGGNPDRKLLEIIELEIDIEDFRPLDEVEEKLAEIWADILGTEKDEIGVNSNFFELGGHSLSATILAAKIHREFNVKISLADIFKAPEIVRLSEYINRLAEEKYESIQPGEKKEYYALSSAQHRLFVLQQLNPKSFAYNLPEILVSPGELDKEKLERIFGDLIKRHESLRTSFHMLDDTAVQKIHDKVAFEIEYYQVEIKVEETGGLAPLSISANRIPQPAIDTIKNFIRPFDLARGPLVRVGLIKAIDDKNHLLMVDMHHVISDGVSHSILVKDFADIYTGVELSTLKLQYKDFSEWQSSEKKKKELEEQKSYWMARFRGNIPLLNLPADHSRPVIQGFEGKSVHFELSSSETGQLNRLAKKGGSTLYIVLLAVFNLLLAKLSGQEDIIIGTPVAGRTHADLGPIIGMFINTVVIRNILENDHTFIQFLDSIRENTLKAFENQEFPFEELLELLPLEREVSRNPLFDVMFVMQNWEFPRVQIPGLQLKRVRFETYISKFDLTLFAIEVEEKLILNFEYCTRLFEPETIERYITFYKRIIAVILKAPDKKISEVEIISGEEKRQMLFDFNDTKTGTAADKLLHELFQEQAGKNPDNIALVGPEFQIPNSNPGARIRSNGRLYSITYKELNKKVNQLAVELKNRGVKPGSIVGITSELSLELLIGIFGILKAGGAYLPVDLEYPEERVLYMLRNSNIKLVLTQYAHLNYLQFTGEIVNINDKSLSAGIPGNFEDINASTDPAYILYTSGSTGKPKGVIIEHKGIVNYLKWAESVYIKSEKCDFPLYSSLSFDLTVTSLYLPLISGNKLFIYQQDDNEALISKIIRENKVQVIKLTPTHLKIVNDLHISNSNIKRLIVGGEELTTKLARDIYVKFKKDIEIYNEYGPTETVVGCMIYKYRFGKDKRKSVPIGTPVDNTQIYILDRYQNPLPKNITGEIWISGNGVARGYLNNPRLTREKFKENPFLEGRRIYKSGDLARFMTDGNLEFLGRIDQQVKIRGFRIELNEIENELIACDEIKEAVVVAGKNQGRGECLCAYVVAHQEVQVSRLKEYLSRKLPDFMIPSYFTRVEKIPLTPNGKVNQKALQALDINLNMNTGVEYAAPENENEELIAAAWKEVLHNDNVGVHDNFFDVGGHSLNIIRVNNKLKQAFQKDIPLVVMFRYPTIRSLARYIDNQYTDEFISDEKIDRSLDIMEETTQFFFGDSPG